ncbi:MAG: restriction endonuclease subunit M [Calditrichaeota bacterium]|nr:MAG: restriction endonuclease subunit M [Calditrichota bacterium]
MLQSKEQIEILKKNSKDLANYIQTNLQNNPQILFLLKNLGRLPNDFDGEWLYGLTQNENPKIRFWAIKNIGKLKSNGDIKILKKLIQNETDTANRREIISSIGRKRNSVYKSLLLETLDDNDPKVVCQAIRGLLVFKLDDEITEKLKALRSHKNEMVQTIIRKEFFQEKTSKKELPHKETFDYLKNVVVNGDVLEVLKLVPEESVHLTFTSPPYYNARDYSIYQSYQDYLNFLEEVFLETHRVTKEGRFLLVNTSPIIIPRISRQHSSKRYPIPFDLHPLLVKMGWEYIDDIIWQKPEASVKNRNAGFLQHRKPLGYKPNAVTEMVMVYRKQTDKLIDWNIKQYDFETVKRSKVSDGYETSNVWKIDPKFDKIHSAIFPVDLCQKIISYYSFEGDLVFDPFAGSGTLGRTAKALNRLFFLTEKDEKYFNYMKSKNKSQTLFGEPETRFFTLKEFDKEKNDTN